MDVLYLNDCYLKEFEATVVNVIDDRFAILDRTAFYPDAGGQPNDTGVLVRDGSEYPVVYVQKTDDRVSHEIADPGLIVGDQVTGRIDWGRRYLFMRSHTACHVLSAVINKETGALITGNRIGEARTRVDFSLDAFDRQQIKSFEEKTNEIIDQGIPVEIKILPAKEALKTPSIVKLKMDLPEMEEIRIIDIVGFDAQACGGTHVRNTGEIGQIEVVKAENKGKNNRRIYFRLGMMG
uniref:Alanyl-tRNA editing protein AlaX-M n=1 Tax=Candidatus Methanogaster sp. ANME-2c ERB4 TaxID=2759911 RepID=A0A7G9Y952_9EURY|nr:alanyl-tRNA editing protein AlaX-M [Methanosarcinales archaeon ANME-2c ERB4]QNO49663.1 alanyl-tRNA editing protein AlaX-M [Methanosarcinales archaeon ANME-2c ERB4]QNO50104.1 alanyl-tRNA editing protein AlaX-M [Methanosarcinales archaeon ANME-2c ERB4]